MTQKQFCVSFLVPTVDQVFALGNVREQLVECLVVLDEALNTGDGACYSVCCVLWQRHGSTEALGVMRQPHKCLRSRWLFALFNDDRNDVGQVPTYENRPTGEVHRLTL